jgi:hypothetical protein
MGCHYVGSIFAGTPRSGSSAVQRYKGGIYRTYGTIGWSEKELGFPEGAMGLRHRLKAGAVDVWLPGRHKAFCKC